MLSANIGCIADGCQPEQDTAVDFHVVKLAVNADKAAYWRSSVKHAMSGIFDMREMATKKQLSQREFAAALGHHDWALMLMALGIHYGWWSLPNEQEMFVNPPTHGDYMAMIANGLLYVQPVTEALAQFRSAA